MSVAWERIGGVPTHVYENGCFAALSKLHSRHEASLWRRPRIPSVCVQALEECVLSMRRGEITLLLAHSRYAYGPLGR